MKNETTSAKRKYTERNRWKEARKKNCNPMKSTEIGAILCTCIQTKKFHK